ncbi:GSCFA domain-containing protein [Fundidesulfovibrio putealis]|uniref:GSCFA domain-containing protein n=1 Tax=Fundidesulfovibrio putealis TaxID=270496 RepID=UPI00042A6F47|nr:GSCFA domain-containing protein [Fundidesulfovibrio putealis]
MSDSFLKSGILSPRHEVFPIISLMKNELITGFDSKFVSFGSCFAANISAALCGIGIHCYFKREICRHFSTESLLNVLKIVTNENSKIHYHKYDDYVGGINPWQFSIGRIFQTQDDVSRIINELVKEFRNEIERADNVIFTLGTNIIIRDNVTGVCISTSDKMPPESYAQLSLSVAQIVGQLNEIHDEIVKIKGGERFNFFVTLSPQRYSFVSEDDGAFNTSTQCKFVQNNLSKSICRVAIDEFIRSRRRCYYFPSYEIVVDELRLQEQFVDKLHVDLVRTGNYVVSRFIDQYFSEKLIDVIIKEKLGESDKRRKVQSKIVTVGEQFFAGKKLDEFISRIASAIANDPDKSWLFEYYVYHFERHWGTKAIDLLVTTVLDNFSVPCFWGVSGRFEKFFSHHLAGRQVLLVDTNRGGDVVGGSLILSPDEIISRPEVDVIIISSTHRESIKSKISDLKLNCRIL